MTLPKLPEHFARITPGEPFFFECHPDIDCFTHCCRQLELALTPYDMLRLRNATKLSSAELLARYVIKEQDEADIFPHFYLTMVDDGNESCVFVTPQGCSIYDHRPSACRTYPMGRATVRKADTIEEYFVLLHEPHCHGFKERTIQTVSSFTQSQELEPYNRFNDMVVDIQQHEKIRNGMKLSQSQLDTFTLALYDLDTFRQKLKNNQIVTSSSSLKPDSLEDDEALLLFAFEWLKFELFS